MRNLFLCWLLFLPFATQAETRKVPQEKELSALSRESLLAFSQAIGAKDFTAFHAQISEVWKQQITPEKLGEIFQMFIEQQIDLSPVIGMDPVFTPAPKVDDDGVLVLEGRFPITPSRVEFRLKYVWQKPAWKLLAIKVNLMPAGQSNVKAPGEKEAKALVRASLLAFNEAVQEKSFVEFHEGIASAWRKQTTPEKLQSFFQTFVDQEVDIAPVATLEPAFTQPPAIDGDGVLELKGEYARRQHGVRFDLAYIYEAEAWRLVKINVKVGKGEDDEKEN